MLIEDRASELRDTEDLWSEVAQQVADAALDAMKSVRSMAAATQHDEVMKDLKEKYLRGEQQYDREWLNMSLADLEQEVYQELLDLVIYHCLIRARFRLVQ